MKKYLLLILFAFITIVGCKNEDPGNPETVLHSFFDAMAKQDIETARQYATKESKSFLDMMSMISKLDSNSTIETSRYLKENIEFGKVRYQGEEAIIKVKHKNESDSMEFTLVKEDEKWKVAFDLSSILTIGMQKMKENGLQSNNKLKDALNEINQVGVDSLKKEADAQMQKLDDAIKSLKLDGGVQ